MVIRSDADKSFRHSANIQNASLESRTMVDVGHVVAGDMQPHLTDVPRSNLRPFWGQSQRVDCTWSDRFLESSARLDLDLSQRRFEAVEHWPLLRLVVAMCLIMLDRCSIWDSTIPILRSTMSQRSDRVPVQYFADLSAYVGSSKTLALLWSEWLSAEVNLKIVLHQFQPTYQSMNWNVALDAQETFVLAAVDDVDDDFVVKTKYPKMMSPNYEVIVAVD